MALSQIKMIIFESASKFLLLLHVISAIVLLGSVSHNFLLMLSYFRGNVKKMRLQKLYLKVGFISFVCTYLLGGVFLYPTFRYNVRHLFFDKTLPWATGLFEIKEHWESMALVIFIAYYLLSRYIDPKENRHLLKVFASLTNDFVLWYAMLGIILAVIIWYSVIVGFLLTSYKSV